jgi:DNA-directed RNA polymerase subunit RPC12/RpoP
MLQRLEAEGIRAYLQDEHTVTIDPILSNAIGGIKLMVFEEQLPRAQELLQQFEQDYIRAVACPRCGSHNVLFVSQPNNPANWFSAIASWFLGSYAVSVKQVYRCFDCNNEFEDLPGEHGENEGA